MQDMIQLPMRIIQLFLVFQEGVVLELLHNNISQFNYSVLTKFLEYQPSPDLNMVLLRRESTNVLK